MFNYLVNNKKKYIIVTGGWRLIKSVLRLIWCISHASDGTAGNKKAQVHLPAMVVIDDIQAKLLDAWSTSATAWSSVDI